MRLVYGEKLVVPIRRLISEKEARVSVRGVPAVEVMRHPLDLVRHPDVREDTLAPFHCPLAPDFTARPQVADGD
jgi:hypothetical protein